MAGLSLNLINWASLLETVSLLPLMADMVAIERNRLGNCGFL